MDAMEPVMAFLQSLQGGPAYALLFAALVASGFGLPINEDILLLVAAALTLRGVVEPLPLVAVAWAGILCADALIFHWGHRFGAPLLRHRIAARMLPPARLERVQATMRRWGPVCLFAVRFLPGLRTGLLFAAGSLKMHYRHLLVFDGLAGLVEIPLLVGAVRLVGGRWQEILALLQAWQPVLWALFALGAVALVLVLRRRHRRPAGDRVDR